MKFSEKWLREWVNPNFDTDTLVAKLTQAGLEVDAVTPVAGDFQGVLVGQVKSVKPHPDADKLRICEVDVAADELLNIVCGAANVRENLKVPVAVIGAVLPGNFKIKQAKLRGEPSFGMLCSAKELGLAESSEGLLELAADAPVGQDIREYLDLDDQSIEVDLTPNRSDCLGVAGIAREVGVISQTDVMAPAMPAVTPVNEATLPITVSAASACPRYLGRVIKGINPQAESPLWLKEKLRRSGLRSLGAIVDITNYVLLELGQPMHAFDLAKISGGVEVRFAAKGESLTLLDGQTIELQDASLLITDNNGPLALAGIMGGQASAVSDDSVDIFLESAFFAPEAIAGQARKYGLHTDSSHRFERGVDPELAKQAMERASQLIIAIAGGQPGPVIEQTSAADLPKPAQITLRAERIKRVLGISLPADDVAEKLTRLGLKVAAVENGWQVEVPSFRFDLAIEVDLIEELGRLYGYDQLPQTRPEVSVLPGQISEHQLQTERLQDLLVDRGYFEAITYSFVDPNLHQHFAASDLAPIALANPISADLSVMRQSLWPGLVQALSYNLNRQQDRVRLFEIGRVFNGDKTAIKQELRLGGLIYGDLTTEQWAETSRKVDFYDAKADVEALLIMGGGEIEFVADTHPALHPGQTARILKNGQSIGWLGALHPKLNKPLDINGRVFVFELALSAILSAQVPEFSGVSRYPAIRRDLALVVEQTVTGGQIEHCLKSIDSDILKAFQLFDVYTGDGVEHGKKSIAIAFRIQHGERTLTDEEVDALMTQITDTLQSSLGAVIRA